MKTLLPVCCYCLCCGGLSVPVSHRLFRLARACLAAAAGASAAAALPFLGILWLSICFGFAAEGHLKIADTGMSQQQQQQQQQEQQQRGDTAKLLQLLRTPLARALEALHLPPLASDASPAEALAALQVFL